MIFFVLLSTNIAKMNGECLNLIAIQYDRAQNYDIAKTYYLLAIEDGNANAMHNLGDYYYTVEKNYNEMKKYYLIAIEHGHITAMNNLGQYYYTIEKNTELSKKYLLMAYPRPTAINNLQFIAKYNPELFYNEFKNKSITLDQLCLIYDNTAKLLEHLGGIYAKYACPYVLELIHELNKKIFGTLCILECPVCWETNECGHYPCDERHIICRDCYWKSPNKCYYRCTK